MFVSEPKLPIFLTTLREMTSFTVLLVVSGLVAMTAAYPSDMSILENILEEIHEGREEGLELDLDQFEHYLQHILEGTPAPPPQHQLKAALLQAMTGRGTGAMNNVDRYAMLQELFEANLRSQALPSNGDNRLVHAVQQQEECPESPVVDCGDLPTIPKGQVSSSSTLQGSVATYTCDEYYFVNGSSSRSCDADSGTWLPEEPFCQLEPGIADCGLVPSINNGGNEYTPRDSTIENSMVSATCNEGYYKDGPATRYCLANGDWTGSRVYCRGCRGWWQSCGSQRECCGLRCNWGACQLI